MAGNHTPGPWMLGRPGGPQGPFWMVLSENKGWIVAPQVDGEANAYLIAAAPDLLAALEALNLQMPPAHIRDDGRSEFAMPVGAIRAAFAAIAKAKGEAS